MNMRFASYYHPLVVVRELLREAGLNMDEVSWAYQMFPVFKWERNNPIRTGYRYEISIIGHGNMSVIVNG